jgi:hypothetical protein
MLAGGGTAATAASAIKIDVPEPLSGSYANAGIDIVNGGKRIKAVNSTRGIFASRVSISMSRAPLLSWRLRLPPDLESPCVRRRRVAMKSGPIAGLPSAFEDAREAIVYEPAYASYSLVQYGPISRLRRFMQFQCGSSTRLRYSLQRAIKR